MKCLITLNCSWRICYLCFSIVWLSLMQPQGCGFSHVTNHKWKNGFIIFWQDVASRIMAFSQQGSHAICILSANGAICNATLRQPATFGGTVTYEVWWNGTFSAISKLNNLDSAWYYFFRYTLYCRVLFNSQLVLYLHPWCKHYGCHINKCWHAHEDLLWHENLERYNGHCDKS